MKFCITLCILACTATVSANDISYIVKSTIKGSNTGAIDLSINAGVSPYQISWAGPNGFKANTEDLSNLGVGTYTVTITDNYCGTATIAITVTDYLTGIDEMSEEQIRIFPNPATTEVQIELPEFFKGYHFRIMNTLGAVIIEKKNVPVSFYTVDLSLLSAGMYVVEVSKDGRLYRKKMMKH